MMRWLLLAWAASVLGTGGGGESIAVIVHNANPVEIVARRDVEAIFSRRVSYWPNGQRVIPLNLPPKSPLRQRFDRAVLGFEPQQMVRFWIDQRIRGKGRAPRTVGNVNTMGRAVAALQGAVGYVPTSQVPSGVRVVFTIDVSK